MQFLADKVAETALCAYISLYGDTFFFLMQTLTLAGFGWLLLELLNSKWDVQEVRKQFAGAIFLIAAPTLTYVAMLIRVFVR